MCARHGDLGALEKNPQSSHQQILSHDSNFKTMRDEKMQGIRPAVSLQNIYHRNQPDNTTPIYIRRSYLPLGATAFAPSPI